MRTLTLIFCLLSSLSGASAAKDSGLSDLRKAMKAPGREMAQKLAGRVCVLDFSETGDTAFTSEFGQAAAEFLSSELVRRSRTRFTVIERRELVKIMQDSVIFGSEPDAVEKLRKAAGMQVLVSGSYASDEKSVSVSIRATSADNGAVLASATLLLGASPGLRKMMDHRFKYVGSQRTGDAGEGPTSDALEVEAGVFYEGGDGRLYPVHEGMVLTSKDNYAIYALAKEACHLYVYQIDSAEKAVKLFPNPQIAPTANPLKPSRAYWIPNDKDFLYLDENRGREAIYIFATRGPSAELEGLKDATFTDIQQAIKTMGVGGVRGSELSRKVKGAKKDPMELIMHRLASKGDFYYRLNFLHQ